MRNQLDRWLTRHQMPDPNSSTREERRDYFDGMPEALKNEYQIRKAAYDCATNPEYNSGLVERARKRMARVDEMPAELREVVYDYGLEIVQEFLNCGLKTPSRIRHLIDTVRNTDLPGGQTRFKVNKGPNMKINPIVQMEREDQIYYSIPNSSR